MQQSKFQFGRSMLEMLTVLAIVGILSLAALVGFKYAMDHHKANQMLDYINRVFLATKAKGDDDRSVAPCLGTNCPIDQTYFACEDLVPDMPEIIFGCGANRSCVPGQQCVTNVFAYFQPGEYGAAAALESKLGLKPRGKRPPLNRMFQKSSCENSTPITCSHGFAKCAAVNGACDGTPWEFTNGDYTDADCENQTEEGKKCRVW